MKKLPVKIINKSGFDLPKYETIFSAGMDLRALVDEAVTLKPLERKLEFLSNFLLDMRHKFDRAVDLRLKKVLQF